MHWAFTFDAKTCHGTILGTALDFVRAPKVFQWQWRGNGEAMAKQWRSNGEAMGKFLGGFLIQWGNQGESE